MPGGSLVGLTKEENRIPVHCQRSRSESVRTRREIRRMRMKHQVDSRKPMGLGRGAACPEEMAHREKSREPAEVD
jgi:hypothetical protein